MENLPIGSTFKFQNKTLKVVEETKDKSCADCYFFYDFGCEGSEPCQKGLIPQCSEFLREDGKPVIFIEED